MYEISLCGVLVGKFNFNPHVTLMQLLVDAKKVELRCGNFIVTNPQNLRLYLTSYPLYLNLLPFHPFSTYLPLSISYYNSSQAVLVMTKMVVGIKEEI